MKDSTPTKKYKVFVSLLYPDGTTRGITRISESMAHAIKAIYMIDKVHLALRDGVYVVSATIQEVTANG